MRSASILLPIAVAGTVALPAAQAAREQPGPRICADVSYEAGGGYYVYRSSRITALRVRCPAAKRLARVDAGEVTGSEERPRYRALGFACQGTRKSTRTVAFRCTRERDDAVVAFRWTTK